MKDFFSNKCDIVKDLLPIYADDGCSKVTEENIKLHLVTCPECRGYLNEILSEKKKAEKEASVPDSDPQFEKVMDRLRRRKIIRRSLFAAALVTSISINAVLLLTND